MEEQEQTLPVLDTLIQSRELQMMKTVIPYIEPQQQKMFSMIIKLMELQKTMQLFDSEDQLETAQLRICSAENTSERMFQMLNALRKYCTPKEQENIDLFINFFDMFSSCETLFNG